MSEGEKPKLTGIAAVGAAFAALMMKGGMACGSAISHMAKPATHAVEDVAQAAAHAGPGAVKALEEGGAGVAAEVASEAASKGAKSVGRGATDQIVDSGTSLARGEVRRRANEERRKQREEEEKKRGATR